MRQRQRLHIRVLGLAVLRRRHHARTGAGHDRIDRSAGRAAGQPRVEGSTGIPPALKPMKASMNDTLQALMQEATRLTGSGQLFEATKAIQRALRGEESLPASPVAGPEVLDGLVTEVSGRAASNAASPGGFSSGSHTHRTLTRDYKLFVPPGHARPARALVVMLHGCTQHPDDFAAGRCEGTGTPGRRSGCRCGIAARRSSHGPAAGWSPVEPGGATRTPAFALLGHRRVFDESKAQCADVEAEGRIVVVDDEGDVARSSASSLEGYPTGLNAGPSAWLAPGSDLEGGGHVGLEVVGVAKFLAARGGRQVRPGWAAWGSPGAGLAGRTRCAGCGGWAEDGLQIILRADGRRTVLRGVVEHRPTDLAGDGTVARARAIRHSGRPGSSARTGRSFTSSFLSLKSAVLFSVLWMP